MHRTARRRRVRSASVPVLLVALVATACVGGDDAPVEDGAGTGTEAADSAGEPTPTAGPTATNEPDGVLQLGYVLPESGPLALLGPPQVGALEMAVAEINDAGGVLGKEVSVSAGDEAGDPTVAAQTADRLIGEGVDAIIGAAASSMSLAIVDAVTNAGVAQCSGSNTSPTFTGYDDAGLYFRTAPTDLLQGRVLARTIREDGHDNVAIVARADDYGQGLMNATRTALEEQGATVSGTVVYDPEAASFEAEIQQLTAAEADTVVLISFEEGADILAAMIAAGIGPGKLAVYGADGLRSNHLAGLVDPTDPAVLAGVRGTAPAVGISAEFLERYRERSGLEDATFAAQVYDCTILLALAAEAAGSDAGVDLAARVVEVSRGGTKCTSFAECRDLLGRGEDVDYDGASGAVDLTDEGEPEVGHYEVWTIGADGQVSTESTTEVALG